MLCLQDGTVETGISSFELYPVNNLELENFPGDLVMELKPSFNDYGVIECVNRVERTARVQWFKNNPQNLLLYVFIKLLLIKINIYMCYIIIFADQIPQKKPT